MDKADHPNQVRLRAFLDDTQELLEASRVDGLWSLRLDVGFAAGQDLHHLSDLDNYAKPLASRLRNDRLVSVWCTKQYSEQSYVRIEAAREAPPPSANILIATPTASYDKPGGLYKEQVRAAVTDAPELPAGPVCLELAFVVGCTSNYLNLWKPTIDALGPLLGPGDSGRVWDPNDGRITELGMHVTLDPTIRYGVTVGITAALAEELRAR